MMKKKGMAKGGYRGGVKKMKKGGAAGGAEINVEELNPGKMVEGTTRRCDWEEETKEFLGYQAKGYKDGEEIKGEHYGDPFDFHSLSRSKRFEVKRNFRY